MLNTIVDFLSVYGLWALTYFLAGFFIYHAYLKWTGAPGDVKLFEVIGLGQWFRYLTGTLEAVGGIMLLFPATRIYGAILLLAVLIGALPTQFFVLKKFKLWREAFVILVLAMVVMASVNPAI